jgi:hypothetical protein
MVCAVPSCPATAIAGAPFCGPHVNARTAKELGLGPDANGLGAARCGKCGRAFKDDDFVDRTPMQVKTRKGPSWKWLHVRCVPGSARPNRRAIRESDKPLFAK